MERVIVARTAKLPKRLQPMLATLTDGPFDDNDWIFEDKYDGFRMVATIEGGEVTLYSRNGKIVSHNYSEVAKALEGMKQCSDRWRIGRDRQRWPTCWEPVHIIG
jgi:bifunctional non-homologous end joining protein LigD